MNVQVVIFELLASESNDHLQPRCVMHRTVSSTEGVYRKRKTVSLSEDSIWEMISSISTRLRHFPT